MLCTVVVCPHVILTPEVVFFPGSVIANYFMPFMKLLFSSTKYFVQPLDFPVFQTTYVTGNPLSIFVFLTAAVH